MSRGHDRHSSTQEPPGPPVPDAKRSGAHIAEHFFQGVCICACKNCTKSSGNRDKPYCICQSCPPDKCGIKMKGL